MQGFVTNGVTNGKFCDEWLILDIHAAEEIAGDDVEGRGFRVGGMCGMIADAADEAAALYYDIDVGGYEELDAAAEGVDVYFLVLVDDSLAQVHADAAAESVETGTVESLTMIDVLIATIVYRTADALAVLADGQWALQPLVWVTTVAIDNEAHTYIYNEADTEIHTPTSFTHGFKPTPMNEVPNGCQF